jgi:hypothetical protein
MSKEQLSDNTVLRVSDDIVLKVERYNRSLSLGRLRYQETHNRDPLQSYHVVAILMSIFTWTLVFSLIWLDRSLALSDQYYTLAKCFAVALFLSFPLKGPFLWDFSHKDSPRRIYEDPESAAISTAVYPDTMPISLVPLVSDKRGFLSAISEKNNNFYRYSEKWYEANLAIAAIERLQLATIESRHLSAV